MSLKGFLLTYNVMYVLKVSSGLTNYRPSAYDRKLPRTTENFASFVRNVALNVRYIPCLIIALYMLYYRVIHYLLNISQGRDNINDPL